MKYSYSQWYYQGKTYPTLRTALLAVWPARRCGRG